MPTHNVNIGAELQALPLEYLVSAPLVAAIKGQGLAAQTTADFINSVLLKGDGTDVPQAVMVAFSYDMTVPDPTDPTTSLTKNTTLSVPLMALVNVPHLQIEDMNISFEFKIRDLQTTANSFGLANKTTIEAEGTGAQSAHAGFGGGAGFASFLSGKAGIGVSESYQEKIKCTTTGSVTYQSSERRQTDRSATYKFNINVKEKTPEGFLRVLDILNNAITQKAPAADIVKTG